MAKLIILPPAARYLKKLKQKPLKEKFQAIIDQLLLDPYFGEPKTGDLSGVHCCDIFHNKTNYELAAYFSRIRTLIPVTSGHLVEIIKLLVPFKQNV